MRSTLGFVLYVHLLQVLIYNFSKLLRLCGTDATVVELVVEVVL